MTESRLLLEDSCADMEILLVLASVSGICWVSSSFLSLLLVCLGDLDAGFFPPYFCKAEDVFLTISICFV
ncbi:hypothetical protein EJ08DRAFT_650176, partial [Tothia fuscella]